MNKSELEQQMEQSFKLLQKISRERNTFNIKEFINKYSKLYTKINYEELSYHDHVEYTELSKQFLSEIDPYEPIILVDDSGNEIIKFPPLLYPLKELSESQLEVANAIRVLNNPNVYENEQQQVIMRLFSGIMRSQFTEDELERIKDSSSFLEVLQYKTKEFTELTNKANEVIRQAKENVQINNREYNNKDDNDILNNLFDNNTEEEEEVSDSSILDEIF